MAVSSNHGVTHQRARDAVGAVVGSGEGDGPALTELGVAAAPLRADLLSALVIAS